MKPEGRHRLGVHPEDLAHRWNLVEVVAIGVTEIEGEGLFVLDQLVSSLVDIGMHRFLRRAEIHPRFDFALGVGDPLGHDWPRAGRRGGRIHVPGLRREDRGILGQQRMQQCRTGPCKADDENRPVDLLVGDRGKQLAIVQHAQPPRQQFPDLHVHRPQLIGGVGPALVDPVDNRAQALLQVLVRKAVGTHFALCEPHDIFH